MKIFNILLVGFVLNVASLNSYADELNQSITESTTPSQTMNSVDRYESFNRSVYQFNMGFHDYIGAPVVNTYSEYVPSPIQTGFRNFFSNLTLPLDVINSLLQGKVEQSMEGFMRFTINTTFGIGGLLDIATSAGLPKQNEDFGQTLYVWGVWDEASFVMVPFLGPGTTRSLGGMLVDGSVDPIYSVQDLGHERSRVRAGNAFVNYAVAAPLIETVRTQSDPYIFMRESYLQYRTNLIFDGNPPKADLDDFNFD